MADDKWEKEWGRRNGTLRERGEEKEREGETNLRDIVGITMAQRSIHSTAKRHQNSFVCHEQHQWPNSTRERPNHWYSYCLLAAPPPFFSMLLTSETGREQIPTRNLLDDQAAQPVHQPGLEDNWLLGLGPGLHGEVGSGQGSRGELHAGTVG